MRFQSICLALLLVYVARPVASLHLTIIDETDNEDKAKVPCPSSSNKKPFKRPNVKDTFASFVHKDKSEYRRWPSEKLGWNFQERLARRNLARREGVPFLKKTQEPDPLVECTDEEPDVPPSLIDQTTTTPSKTFFKFPTTNKTEQSKQNTTKSPAQLMNESQLQFLEKGTRVAIYWKLYNKYYEAKVLKVDQYLKTRFLVRYVDDGYEEWVDARRDDFKVIGNDENTKWTEVSMSGLMMGETAP